MIPRYDAKQILHRKCRAGPVVSLELGYRDQQIGLQNCVGKIPRINHEIAQEWHSTDVVEAEIDELGFGVLEIRLKPSSKEESVRVATVL